MKKRSLVFIIVGVIVVVVAILFLRRERAPTAIPPAETTQPAPVVATPTPAQTPAPPAAPPALPPAVTAGPATAPASVPTAPVAPPLPAPAAIDEIKLVRVQPGEVLATVNGVQITLDDMLDWSTAPSSLAQDTFNHLLNSAIERELIEQSARSRGVGLTPEQQKQLEEMRASLENPSSDSAQPAMSPEQIEHQLRSAAAGLLRGNLATSAGVPSPYPTQQQVEQYYAAHRAEFGELPADPAQREAAWQKFDAAIRDRFGVQYQEAMETFLDQLKAQANITINEPAP